MKNGIWSPSEQNTFALNEKTMGGTILKGDQMLTYIPFLSMLFHDLVMWGNALFCASANIEARNALFYILG
jgi:hypothetical protein